ncbi:MAG TPA: protein kinase, partial [Thermoanaerobaculia bacterium]|nr:protein kinase [Thermoanaerobaculia bacterium]
HAKILDFGLAKPISPKPWDVETCAPTAGATGDLPAFTRPGSTVGTVAYMSPEQARGETLDPRSDLYSLGAVLYEMTTGRRPFEAPTLALLFDAVLNRSPTPPRQLNPTLDPALERIIQTALGKSRETRFPSAAALRHALEQARREGSPVRADAEHSGPSVAVLYFDNLSGAAEDEYFRDGMTEDITTELAKIKSLRVFPRVAVAAYRDRSAPAQEVGELLHATHVLGGSLRRAGDRLRVTVQLVETESGISVWAERYDREMKDVFAVQEDIARSIANALRLSLTPQEDKTIARKPTDDPQAYDYFLRGRSFTRQQRRGLALEMFEKALEVDPSFALAYAGIANVRAMQFYLDDHHEGSLERAAEACAHAFSLEPDLPEAHVAQARILYAKGEFAEAAEAARAAIGLKPDCESSWDLLGRALFASDRWQEAASLVERAIAANGDDYNVYVPYANALQALGREEELRDLERRHRAALERQLEWVPDDSRARMLLAGSYAALGQRDDALRELERVLSLGTTDSHTIFNAACTYGTLNMKKEAMATLKQAIQAGYAEWDHLARDPDLSCLHEDPEFKRLLAGHTEGI